MDLNLEAAFDEPVDLSHEFEIPSGRLERPELLSLSPVSFTGRLEHAEPGFLLSGRLAFSGVVACARCLAPVPFERREDVSWTFRPAHEKPAEKPPARSLPTARPRREPGAPRRTGTTTETSSSRRTSTSSTTTTSSCRSTLSSRSSCSSSCR